MISKKLNIKSIILYAILIVISSVVFYPVFRIVIYVNHPDNFLRLIKMLTQTIPTFWNNLLSTTIVAVLRSLLVVTVSIMGGYALAKFDFKYKKLLFGIVILSITIPDFLIIIPLLRIVSTLGWINTIWGLVIPAAGSGLGILLMRQYMINYLTDDLIYAAMIDGASHSKILLQIIAPLVKPAIIILITKTAIEAWNEYLKPLVFLTVRSKMTVQVVITDSFNRGGWDSIFIAIYLSILPLLILFIFFSKQIIANITEGSLKY